MCSFLFPDGKPKHTPGWNSVYLSCGHLAYPKMPGPQQSCRELGTSWAEAFSPSAAGFQPVIPEMTIQKPARKSQVQKPLDSRPAYTSRWPLRMGCGKSRDLGSGILT